MMEKFVDTRFRADSRDIVAKANAILEEYADQGFVLTLRQLFYQFVARLFIGNTVKEYSRLGRILVDARRAGLIDWDHIEDRTRDLVALSTWDSPAEILESAARSYNEDLWLGQNVYLESWIEKSALAGVAAPVCARWRVPLMAARGYPSHSELYRAGRRFKERIARGREATVLYFGDHDPSGLDMSRNLESELALYAGPAIEVVRVGLNLEQVRALVLPPNPAKETDKRFEDYVRATGCTESWELDAVPPATLQGWLEAAITERLDQTAWRAALDREAVNRAQIARLAIDWGAAL